MLEQFKKKFFFCYNNKRSKFEVEKVTIWQYFSISSKHRAYRFLIFVFCPSQIKNYIITAVGSNFFMHLVTGWHLLCRKEITISNKNECSSPKGAQSLWEQGRSFLVLEWIFQSQSLMPSPFIFTTTIQNNLCLRERENDIQTFILLTLDTPPTTPYL